MDVFVKAIDSQNTQPFLKWCAQKVGWLFFCAFLQCATPTLAQPTTANATPTPKPKISKLTSHVVLVSIGGLQGLCITTPSSCPTPMITLQRWRNQGAYALIGESVYPSQTLPAHATMLTGRLPIDHKIIGNHAFDQNSGQSQSDNTDNALSASEPTLAGLLTKAGLQTCAVGFPLTGNDPSIISKHLFSVLLHPNTRNLKDSLSAALTRDRSVLAKTLETIGAKPPHLLLVYFNALDIAQQLFGLNSNETAKTKNEIDGYLEQIAKAYEQANAIKESTFIVVSDHGAMKAESVFAPNVLLARKGWITADKNGVVQSWRAITQTHEGSARVLVKNPKDEQDVLALLKEEFAKPDSAIWRIITRQEAAKLGADDRATFFIEAAPGVIFSEQVKGAIRGESKRLSSSGQLPQRTEMRNVFVLYGKGIKPASTFEYGRLTFLAPTIARLLGLEMRVTQGRVLNEVLNP